MPTRAMARQTFPFDAGGAAMAEPLPSGRVKLTDLTALPRFGIKGPGASDWLESEGIGLPAVNRIVAHHDMKFLRLGKEDFLFLAENAGAMLDRLKAAWFAALSPRGYASWREEGWAWMRLGGPDAGDAMARLCALDLRNDRFAVDAIAQTRVGHLEAVLLRSEDGFDILFDITASAFLGRTVRDIADHLPRQPNLSKDDP